MILFLPRMAIACLVIAAATIVRLGISALGALTSGVRQ